jgi:TP901 family phage tail tape measure protein
MPAAKKTTLQIVLQAKNLTAAPFALVQRSLVSLKNAGVAAFAAIGGAITRMGTTLLSLAGPMAAIQSIRLGAAFEEDIAKIGTLGKEARDRLGEFRVELERIAVTSGTPLDDLAEALFNMISAGVSASDAIKTLEEANRLAVAGSANLANSVFALTKVMSAYGLGVEEARSVSEKLFATQVIGQTTVEEVASNLAKVTSVAAALKVPLDQLATAFGDITKVASNSEEAAVSLRSALVGLQKPSSDLELVMGELGLNIENLFHDGRTLGDVFSLITKKSKELGLPLAKVVGNVRAFVAVATLGQDEGKRFAAALENFKSATGDLDVSLELLEATTTRTLGRMREFMKVLAARVAAPWMRELNEQLEGTSSNLDEARIRAEIFGLEILKWAKQASPFMDFLTFAINALSVAARTAFGFGTVLGHALKLIVNTIANMGDVFRTLGNAGQAFIDEMGTQIVSLGGIIKAMLWNVAGIVLKTLILPFQLLLHTIKSIIKGAAQLSWQMQNIFTDAEMPENVGEFEFLEAASARLDEWANRYDSKMGDVGAATERFKDTLRHSGVVGAMHWDQVTSAVGRLWDAVKSGDALTELNTAVAQETDALLQGIVDVDESRKKLWQSLSDLSDGTLGQEEIEQIAKLNQQLIDLNATVKDSKVPQWFQGVVDGMKRGWDEAGAAYSRYDALVAAGFTRLQAITAAFKFPDWKPPSFTDTGLYQKIQQLKEAVSGIGVAWDNAIGAAKLEQTKQAWQSVLSMIGLVFKVAPIDRAKEAMEQWTMTVDELRGAILQTAQNALANFFDQVVAGTANASDAWKAMLSAMLSALNKFMADKIVLQFLQGLGFDLTTPSAGTDTTANADLSAKGGRIAGGFTPVQKFATGGSLPGGFTPIQAFATGGVVTRPTLGLVGEGKHNEAVVPLPDGRSIPVAMSGGGQADSFSITIQAMDAASIKSLLLSDAGQRSIVAAFQNARSTRRGFSR